MDKSANLVVIGGPVSVGKSTVAEALGLQLVRELNDGDALESLLLALLYEKTRVPSEVVELYFLLKRRAAYQLAAPSLTTQVLDRSLFESLWFARHTLNETSYAAFSALWARTIDELINTYGKPRLYVLLTCNWTTFKARLFGRGREFEVLNFRQNEVYWQTHIAEYEKAMREVFARFDLPFVVIATDELSATAVTAQVKAALVKHNLLI